MSSLVAQFIRHQHRIEDSISRFVDALDPARTTTLAELLESPFRNVYWLDRNQLARRLEHTMRFFRGVNPRLPLVFFQIPNDAEHRAAHENMLEAFPNYRDRYIKAGHEAHFVLHATTIWTEQLLGNESGLRIRPCSSFRSTDWSSLNMVPEPGRACPQVLGYWLPPDYPSMLGVSPAVATDCLARMIIHDMGHFVLPRVARHKEPLYDAAMVAAMSVLPGEVKTQSPWEEVLHEHNTDPYFFLGASDRIKRARKAELTPLQSWLREEISRHYHSTANAHLRRELWELPGKRHGLRAVRHVKKRIDYMWATGFQECFA